MTKTYLSINVFDAAIERINYLFDKFNSICVSFSGGKDSTVLLHLASAVALQRNRKIHVMFIDWEAQYTATITHVAEMMIGHDHIIPTWICLPISTPNESSFFDPMFVAWDELRSAEWVRSMPEHQGVVKSFDHFPFYTYGMTFEEFVPEYNQWFSEVNGDTAFLIGLRTDESLNRFRTIKRSKGTRKQFEGKAWSTKVAANSYNFYPLYDWHVEDVWAYIGKNNLPYNRIYDLMYLRGIGLHDMRICEPFSFEARKQLNQYHYLEPQTWDRLVQRMKGVNFGARHGKSELFAYQKINKPEGLTWKEYAEILLDSLPSPLQAHYRRRIDVFIGWFKKHRGWSDLKEESDPKLEAKNLGGSWRMVCRTLLRNDYFCHHLSFSVNKNEYEKMTQLKEKYKDL